MESTQNTIAFHEQIAPDYDELFSSGGTGDWMRGRVQERLLQIFHPGQHILEINCGTGTDAVALGAAGIRVHATDVSEQMVQAAAGKVAMKKLDGMVTTAVLDANHLDRMSGRVFDGAFSNFDGLNHVDNLELTMHQLARLVAPGGRVLCVLLNTTSLWEVAYFIAKLQPGKALRRAFRRGDELSMNGRVMNLHLYSPLRFRRTVRRDFRIIQMRALGLVFPPAGFPKIYEQYGALLHRLEGLDRFLSRMYPFLMLGDHFTVEMERR